MTEKSPWITLITAPARFFETRKYTLGWVSITAILSVLTAICTALQVPYLLRLPAYQSLLARSGHSASLARSALLVSAPVGGLVGVWFTVIVLGFLLWLFVRLFRGQMIYRNAMAIVAHASVITFIGLVASLLVTAISNHFTQSFLSIETFVPGAGKAGTLFTAINVFEFWYLYVQALGVAAIAEMPKSRALTIVFVLWGLMTAISVASAH